MQDYASVACNVSPNVACKRLIALCISRYVAYNIKHKTKRPGGYLYNPSGLFVLGSNVTTRIT